MFVLLSIFLFYKTDFAKWFYLLIAASIFLRLGDKRRRDKLEFIYDKSRLLKIRLIENGMVTIPFLIYLSYAQQFLAILVLLITAVVLALFNSAIAWNSVTPTPFKRLPFEQIVGFRRSFLFVALTYFICLKAIKVQNYNLGLATLIMLFLTIMSFYIKPENKFFVWIFASDSKGFLKRKVVDAVMATSVITVPVLIALFVYFSDNTLITLAVFVIGLIYVISIIVAKYSAFPKEISLPQGTLYALSIWFPPMLLLIIPIFYKQAKRSLEPILEWYQ